MLVFVEGERAGQPFDLEPWQAAIVGNLFGWVDATTGHRRYREGFVFVARKNGKTAICAGIALYLLLCDGEPGAQVYSAAAEQAQAALIFRCAMQMIARQQELLAAHAGLPRLQVDRGPRDGLDLPRADGRRADEARPLGARRRDRRAPRAPDARPRGRAPDRDGRPAPAVDRPHHDVGLRARLDLQREVRLREEGPRAHDRRRLVPARDLRGAADRRLGRPGRVEEGEPEPRRLGEGGVPRARVRPGEGVARVPEHVPAAPPEHPHERRRRGLRHAPVGGVPRGPELPRARPSSSKATSATRASTSRAPRT